MTARAMSAECFNSEEFQASSARVERQVEEFIRARGRRVVTRRDISDDTEIDYSSVAGRVNSLMRKGLVFETGEYIVNANTGKRAAVLRHRDHMAGMQGMLFGGAA